MRKTSTPLDSSLTRLADRLRARPPSAPAVHLGVLGLRNALGPGERAEPADGPVIPVWLGTGKAMVGPLCGTDGAASPCPRCVERRWQELRPIPERGGLEDGGEAYVTGPLPQLTPFAADLICDLVASVAAGERTPHVYQVRLDSLEITRAALLPDSMCPACGTPAPDLPESATVELPPRIKPDPAAVRLRSASDLDLPIDALVNPVCGMLGGIAFRDFYGTATAPVTGAFKIRSRWRLHEGYWSGHASSYGASERYAVLEGLERHAGVMARGKAVTVYDTYANLAPDALDPSGLGYHADMYQGNTVYEQFSPDLPMHWVWGYSLRDKREVLVPEQLVYYLDQRADERLFVQECSNGCASGACLEEAILYGLLELIERDAFLLSWFGKARMAEIDPASCANLTVQLMIDRVGLQGYDLRLFDTRVDLPVPAITAVAVRRDGGLGTICLAAGASLDPLDAVRAAVCETASYVPSFPTRVEQKLDEAREMAADYWKVTELTHHSLLYGLPEMADKSDFFLKDAPMRSLDELHADWTRQRPLTDNLSDDVRYLVDLIAGIGSDVIVVEQTSPEQAALGLRTACVITPGLVPIDFGWARQRVLHHPRLDAFVARGQNGPDQLGATGRHLCPHPFP
ncbi:TOMM precursor leader peptide-binding protein [Acrocarpospora macrocephala]|uniref:TOMM precursor leader peptide-binding protein n=1 Tax=Acrocarpospora macrocephala TaxID=150177 RepID=UPI0014795B12|nr:TOMM precursor leader peptide-binding protein [Acrocarpospora macrocephala]